MTAPRRRYLILAAILFAGLVAIALGVHDRIVRPYGGDFFVVIFLYVLARGLTPLGRLQSALLVFLLGCAAELAQAFDLLAMLGLSSNAAARVIVGVHADLVDIALYAAGAVCALLLDRPRPEN